MIRFYLLGEKGYSVIKSIAPKFSALILDVIVGEDKNTLNDFSSEIINECKKHNINYFKRTKEPNNKPKYGIAIGWRWLIKSRYPLIIIHDSLLPKLRGFNPLVTALINGDELIGATAIMATKGYDEGPIVTQKSIKITYPIKIAKAIKLLSNVYIQIVEDILISIDKKAINCKKQVATKATYSLWRDENDYFINWHQDSNKIKRFIDAVGFPYKGAKTLFEDNIVRILDAETLPDLKIENRIPGKVIFKELNSITVVCGKGLIRVAELYNDDLAERLNFNKFRIRFHS